MSAYLVLDLTIKDLPTFMHYVKNIPTFLRKHNARYLVEGVEPETIEGDWKPQRMVILEFPSKEAAKSFLTDPDVQPLFKIRQESTISNLVLADGSSWRE